MIAGMRPSSRNSALQPCGVSVTEAVTARMGPRSQVVVKHERVHSPLLAARAHRRASLFPSPSPAVKRGPHDKLRIRSAAPARRARLHFHQMNRSCRAGRSGSQADRARLHRVRRNRAQLAHRQSGADHDAGRRLQQAGHKPVVVMGGGTTRIGDPTGTRRKPQDADR